MKGVINMTNTENLNARNEAALQELINNGEMTTMTECAYGCAIADDEKKNKLKKDNK